MSEEKYIVAGKKLRELRKETGLSIFKVAKQLHISGNYLSLLERGKQSPSNTVLYNIAEYYNIDSSELFRLYNKLDPQEMNDIINTPKNIRKLLTQLSLEKKLSDEEKRNVQKEIIKLTEQFMNED